MDNIVLFGEYLQNWITSRNYFEWIMKQLLNLSFISSELHVRRSRMPGLKYMSHSIGQKYRSLLHRWIIFCWEIRVGRHFKCCSFICIMVTCTLTCGKVTHIWDLPSFLATHVNWKWAFFSFNMPWFYQICIVKFFTLTETIYLIVVLFKSWLKSSKSPLLVDVRCSKTLFL